MVTPLAILDAIEPTKLRMASTLLRERHKLVREQVGTTQDSSALAALRDAVAEVAGDTQAERSLASTLGNQDLLRLVAVLGKWDDLDEAVLEILLCRPFAGMLARAWRGWQFTPTSRTVRVLLDDLLSRFDRPDVVPSHLKDAVKDWVHAGDPGADIVRWLDRNDLRRDQLIEFSQGRLLRDSPLSRLIVEGVCRLGNRDQLTAEAPGSLLDTIRQAGPQARVQACRNYLKVLEATAWQSGVLVQIRDWFGMPRGSNSVPSFWRGVSSEDQLAFSQALIGAQLEAAFGSGTERERYWRRWAGRMVDVSGGRSTGGQWIAMEFGSFGVVEFLKVGNAAYFYPIDVLRQLSSSSIRDVGDLKRQIHSVVRPGRDNRLLHHGGPKWHRKGDFMVQAWMRHFADG